MPLWRHTKYDMGHIIWPTSYPMQMGQLQREGLSPALSNPGSSLHPFYCPCCVDVLTGNSPVPCHAALPLQLCNPVPSPLFTPDLWFALAVPLLRSPDDLLAASLKVEPIMEEAAAAAAAAADASAAAVAKVSSRGGPCMVCTAVYRSQSCGSCHGTW